MSLGNVYALAGGTTKATTREEWERALAQVWDRASRAISGARGFRSMRAMWNTENNRQAIIMGEWETLADRLNYEATVASEVRSTFNPLFVEMPLRPKYVVVRETLK
ncbi:MAG: antibiotic biosynthesis monooxygenase [Chloroflexi bacterium]|nr:antibiotic biosynthesis monooxygenase [Chloroflexota bacterium]